MNAKAFLQTQSNRFNVLSNVLCCLQAAAEVTKAVTPVLKEGFSSASKVVEGEIGVAAKAAKSGIDASGVDVKPLVDASRYI